MFDGKPHEISKAQCGSSRSSAVAAYEGERFKRKWTRFDQPARVRSRREAHIAPCADRDSAATPVREPWEEPKTRGPIPTTCDFNGRGVTFLVVGDVTLKRGMKYLFAASLHLKRPCEVAVSESASSQLEMADIGLAPVLSAGGRLSIGSRMSLRRPG